MTCQTVPEFRAWPKIGRLNKDMVITEKIDGTNAAVGVTEDGQVYAQSRTKIITPGDDNFGFAAWVQAHAPALHDLGPGLHFGEWWGGKIQRGYGVPDKRFSLFNVNRWTSLHNGGEAPSPCALHEHDCIEVPVCKVVPVLCRRTFDTDIAGRVYDILQEGGSVAAPGFDNPEGIVVFHTGNQTLFKLSDAK